MYDHYKDIESKTMKKEMIEKLEGLQPLVTNANVAYKRDYDYLVMILNNNHVIMNEKLQQFNNKGSTYLLKLRYNITSFTKYFGKCNINKRMETNRKVIYC